MAKAAVEVYVVFLVLLQALLELHAVVPFSEQRSRWMNKEEIQEEKESKEDSLEVGIAREFSEGLSSDKNPWTDSTNKLREAHEINAETESDRNVHPQFSEELKSSFPGEWKAKNELHNSEKLQDVKIKTDEQVNKKDSTKLESTVAELKTAVATMSQQIDALLRQDSETLKLLNAKSSKIEKRNVDGKKEEAKQRVEVTTTGGASYVRWGRTSCSNSSGTLSIYKGYMGSTHYTNTGGGSDFLCLHEDPEWGVYHSGNQASAYIHGTEYKLGSAEGSPFSTRNNQNLNLEWNDAPCAVCHNALRSNHLMIPARRSCPLGWTVEYRGYLVSSHHTHKRSSYICLDEAPETTRAGQGQEDGELLYPVEANCGSLACPKYVGGYEVACVVCTK